MVAAWAISPNMGCRAVRWLAGGMGAVA